MTGILGTAALFLILFVLQTSVFSTLFLWMARATDLSLFAGQTLNLPLLLLVYLGLHRDRSGVVLWSVVAGIVAGWFGPAWKGAGAVGFLVVGFLGGVARNAIRLEGTGAVALLAGAVTFAEGVVHLWFGSLMSGVQEPVSGHFGLLVFRAGVHALAAPPLFVLFKWVDGFSGASQERGTRSLLTDY